MARASRRQEFRLISHDIAFPLPGSSFQHFSALPRWSARAAATQRVSLSICAISARLFTARPRRFSLFQPCFREGSIENERASASPPARRARQSGEAACAHAIFSPRRRRLHAHDDAGIAFRCMMIILKRAGHNIGHAAIIASAFDITHYFFLAEMQQTISTSFIIFLVSMPCQYRRRRAIPLLSRRAFRSNFLGVGHAKSMIL